MLYRKMVQALSTDVAREVPESNVIRREDLPVHRWYRFVLSYPPHRVRKYVEVLGVGEDDLLCDPFCGTGTTLVEAKKLGIASVGCDAHPFAAMVSRVKTNWHLSPAKLREIGRSISVEAEMRMEMAGLPPESFSARLMEEGPIPAWQRYKLGEEAQEMMPTGFVSDRPLARLLILREEIDKQTAEESAAVGNFFRVAMSHVIANGAGNFAFGPEIYRTRAKHDYDVAGHFVKRVFVMTDDLERRHEVTTPTKVYHARSLETIRQWHLN